MEPMEITMEPMETTMEPMEPLNHGAPVVNNYVRNVYLYDKVINKIGSGAHSDVYEARRKDRPDFEVALKKTKVKKTDEHYVKRVENVINEVKILRNCINHPNIVKFIEFYYDKSRDSTSFYTVLELLKGGELFRRILKRKTFSELEARNYAITMLTAIKHCHDLRIVHR
jgi:serine/threonine protein kinase